LVGCLRLPWIGGHHIIDKDGLLEIGAPALCARSLAAAD